MIYHVPIYDAYLNVSIHHVSILDTSLHISVYCLHNNIQRKIRYLIDTYSKMVHSKGILRKVVYLKPKRSYIRYLTYIQYNIIHNMENKVENHIKHFNIKA